MKEAIYHKLRAGWPEKPTRPIPVPEIRGLIEESKRWLAEQERKKQEPREPAPF